MKLFRTFWQNWRLRHQHPFSFFIHLLGIPITGVGYFMIVFSDSPWWGIFAIVFGYVLQYLGHCVEGNDMGEWIAIKKLFGWKYTAIAPRYLSESKNVVEEVSQKQSSIE